MYMNLNRDERLLKTDYASNTGKTDAICLATVSRYCDRDPDLSVTVVGLEAL